MIAVNCIGDSFLNKCYNDNPVIGALQNTYTSLLGWTEPYPLLFLLLLLLILLPAIFRYSSKSSFLKISRLYTLSRLGLMSLFHQIGYSYTLITPLSYFIQQPSPCSEEFGQYSLGTLAFPSAIVFSATVCLFSIIRFSGSHSIWVYLASAILLILITLLAVAENFASLFQAICTIAISYIIHFIHLQIPFKYIHIENFIVFCICISVYFYCYYAPWSVSYQQFKQLFFEMCFSFLVLIIDELLLIRYQLSRGGFHSFEKAADITWTSEISHVESIRLLNSEEEESYFSNTTTDISTSIIALTIFYIGVLARRIVAPNFFIAPD